MRTDTSPFASPDHAETTLDSIGDAVLSTDIDGNVVYLNPAAEALTGWSRAAAMGRPLDEVFRLIDRDTRSLVRHPMTVAVELNETVGLAGNCILIARDGKEAAIEDSAAPIHDKDGHLTGAVMVFRDVGAALAASHRMSHLAQHDVLTGLPNRLLLTDRLGEAIARASRQGSLLAVLFVDVDGFKAVNDSLGHATADGVLQSIAARLTGVLRRSDTVCRYGGDEFVILLSEVEHAEDAALVARKLRDLVAEPHEVGRQQVSVTASIGISLYPDDGRDADSLIAHADALMYDAKRREDPYSSHPAK
jgi:diguanylate cyclase (GGDEF)-like protein/PAS domain S-box-containing protein